MSNEGEITFREHRFASAFSGSLRFGRSGDITNLFGTSEESEDYIYGLIYMGIFMMTLFLVWFFAIIFLRCMGKHRVGFWAGQGFQQAVDDPGYTEKPYERASFRLRSTRVRIWFLLCSLVFIIFSILSVTNGLSNLQSTVDTVSYNSYVVDGLSREASDILSSVKGVRETAVRIKEQLVTELNGDNFCPGNALLEDSGASTKIVSQANQAIPYLTELENFAGDDLDGLESAANELQSAAGTVQEETDNIDLTSWQSLIILIPFTIIPAILMSATILAMFDAHFHLFTCLVNWIIFPLFFILVISACIISTVMIIAVGINSDFCLPKDQNGPQTVDTTVLNILPLQGYPNTTNEYKLAEFYITNCQTRDPFEQIERLEVQLKNASVYLEQLGATMSNTDSMAPLELLCNRDFESVRLMIIDIVDIMQVVVNALSRTIALTKCDTIVPIYASTAYDATCDYSMTALMWLFMGMLVVAFAGFWMLTLRSAYKPTQYIDSQEFGAAKDSPMNDNDEEDEYPARRQSNHDNQSVDDSLYY
ncbi:hypothetical protein FisN_4Lu516 [Fistulifera solaris]|uniref:Protein tweety homolog n=1 Tax=Fistulifera solaris TaxID=1519565 RepID=A0A1Z5JZF2_FISSO|nr:hypothetical protein FisN_4Lu516 [Fistulifera solaris]|eukprot:GAX19262.1 hypothetical protein FisN_4Lu516 [Fistulifera solaris]